VGRSLARHAARAALRWARVRPVANHARRERSRMRPAKGHATRARQEASPAMERPLANSVVQAPLRQPVRRPVHSVRQEHSLWAPATAAAPLAPRERFKALQDKRLACNARRAPPRCRVRHSAILAIPARLPPRKEVAPARPARLERSRIRVARLPVALVQRELSRPVGKRCARLVRREASRLESEIRRALPVLPERFRHSRVGLPATRVGRVRFQWVDRPRVPHARREPLPLARGTTAATRAQWVLRRTTVASRPATRAVRVRTLISRGRSLAFRVHLPAAPEMTSPVASASPGFSSPRPISRHLPSNVPSAAPNAQRERRARKKP
jgi:hypothetical protein